MTDKEKLEKVRAEIERRIEELQPFNTSENLRAHGALTGYYQILSFIDSMQEVSQVKESAKTQHIKVMCKENGNSLTQEPTIPDIVDEHFHEMLDVEPVSEDLEKELKMFLNSDEYINTLNVSGYLLIARHFAKWQKEQIEEILLSEVLPCFMHGGEADEVVAKLDEVLNQKK